MTPIALSRPPGAALLDKVNRFMDVILHIGAQRTASTTFQHYMRCNADTLRRQGIGFWGPLRTRRGGLLAGIVPVKGPVTDERQFTLARGRIAVQCEKAEQRGIKTLIISDENMLGNVRQNLRDTSLYRDGAERMARFAAAFDGRVTRVVTAIRSLDAYWASSLAYGVGRGHAMPGPDELDRIVTQTRSWRDVIEEASRAFAGAELQVQCHEAHAGRPERRLWHMADGAVEPPLKEARLWLNRAPDLARLRRILAARDIAPDALPSGEGRWNPFDDLHVAALRETYADDLFWLRAGADGKAKLIEEMQPDTSGANLPGGADTRGQDDDERDGSVARTG
jgi:hypothetical protein